MYSQLALLTKQQQQLFTTTAPNSAEDVATQYILPLENLVRHFQSFFLSPRSRNSESLDNDTGSVMDMASHVRNTLYTNMCSCLLVFVYVW
jgi:hypothetical protein